MMSSVYSRNDCAEECHLWVREEVVLAVHLRQLAEHGWGEGIRDEELLQSALARPQNLLANSDLHDLASLAAAYAYGIARNHPFIDRNKRMALIVARLLLLLNGTDLVTTQEEKYSTFLVLAADELSEEDLGRFSKFCVSGDNQLFNLERRFDYATDSTGTAR